LQSIWILDFQVDLAYRPTDLVDSKASSFVGLCA